MATPTTRSEFKEHILRRLGKPVIEINVDEDQLDDRVDEALRYFYDYHFDGSEKIYYKHQITAEDLENRYIPLPENIMGVVRIFDVSDSLNTNNLFNVRYQIALNDLYTVTRQSLVPYWMARQNIALFEEILVGKQPIRYNRHVNRLHVDMDWGKVNEGNFLIVEAYEVIDPNQWSDVWGDRWLQRYAAVLVQEQWGKNLTKFVGMQLPGGVQFNGEQILADAKEQKEKLETEMINSYSLPVSDMIG